MRSASPGNVQPIFAGLLAAIRDRARQFMNDYARSRIELWNTEHQEMLKSHYGDHRRF